jgi:hypothetical protein
LILLLAGGLLSVNSVAQDDASDDELRLNLDFGYRWKMGFRGSEDLYRSQLDLGQGPKLFSGDLFFAPAPGSNRLLDRLELNLGSWGGEPYNTARFRMMKNGLYDLDFNYQNVSFFNSIPTFANPLIEKGSLLSQHREDSSLRTAGVELRLFPGATWTPIFAYQRTSRFGRVNTTFSGDWDEFELNKELDFSSDDLRLGLLYQRSNFSAQIEQGGRWYRDLSRFTSPGFQEGNSSRPYLGRDIYLDRYAGNQDVKSRIIPYSTLRLTYTPLNNVVLQGRASYSQADFRTRFYEDLAGNFFSYPALKASYTGREDDVSGRFKSPNLLVDLSGQWLPVSRVRIVERFQARRSHLSGSRSSSLTLYDVDPALSIKTYDQLDLQSVWETLYGQDYDRQQLEGIVAVTPELDLRVGHRYEKRSFELALSGVDELIGSSPLFGRRSYEASRNVLIVGGAYRFSGRNRLSVDYEHGITDQPIFRTSVTDFDRLKIQGRFSPSETLEFNGLVSLFDNQEEVIDYNSENRSYSLQFNYRPFHRVGFSGQWDRTDWNTRIPYLAPQSLTWDLFRFEEQANYGNLFVDLTLVRNSRLSLGYSVWGNTGTFPVNFHQPVARLEIPFGERLAAYGQWNYYDYNEKVRFYPQDYRTHLATFGLRVSIDK